MRLSITIPGAPISLVHKRDTFPPVSEQLCYEKCLLPQAVFCKCLPEAPFTPKLWLRDPAEPLEIDPEPRKIQLTSGPKSYFLLFLDCLETFAARV